MDNNHYDELGPEEAAIEALLAEQEADLVFAQISRDGVIPGVAIA